MIYKILYYHLLLSFIVVRFFVFFVLHLNQLTFIITMLKDVTNIDTRIRVVGIISNDVIKIQLITGILRQFDILYIHNRRSDDVNKRYVIGKCLSILNEYSNKMCYSARDNSGLDRITFILKLSNNNLPISINKLKINDVLYTRLD